MFDWWSKLAGVEGPIDVTIVLARHVAGSFYFVFRHPEQRSFIGWLLLFCIVAVGVTLFERGRASPAAVDGEVEGTALPRPGFWKRAFPPEVYLHRSTRMDLKFFIVDKVLEFLLLSGILLSSAWIAHGLANAARSGLGLEGPILAASVPLTLAFALLSLIAYDAGYAFSHMLTHRVPLLWEFHKVHHSAEVLTPLTNFREHPVDKILAAFCYAPLVGTIDGIFFLLVGPDVAYFRIFDVNAVFFAYYFLVSFRHSNIWIPYGPIFGRVFSSPAQHQIHHSSSDRHIDKNYAQIFSFLDVAMGSLYLPRSRETFEFGLTTPDPVLIRSIWRMYANPFLSAWRVLRAGSAWWRPPFEPSPAPETRVQSETMLPKREARSN